MRSFLSIIAVCGLALLFSQTVHVQAVTPTLVGSWQFTLTPNPPPVPPAVPAITGLATFNSTGNVIESDISEAVPHQSSTGTVTFATAGHGIWQLSPAITNYYVQYISILVNQNGTMRGRKVTTMTVALNSTGDQFSGGYTTELVDPTGQIVSKVSGTVTAQVIPHPKLP